MLLFLWLKTIIYYLYSIHKQYFSLMFLSVDISYILNITENVTEKTPEGNHCKSPPIKRLF